MDTWNHFVEGEPSFHEACLTAAFGGALPSVTGVALVPAVLAERFNERRVAMRVGVDDPSRAGVWVAGAVPGALDAACAAIGLDPAEASAFGGDVLVIEGPEGVRVLLGGTQPLEGRSTPDGNPCVGELRGAGGSIALLGLADASAPASLPAGPARDAATRLASAIGGEAIWVRATTDGAVTSVFALLQEDLYPARAAEGLAALGTPGGAWARVRDVYHQHGIRPSAYWIEFHATGAVDLAIHGVRHPRDGLGGDVPRGSGDALRAAIVDAAVFAVPPADADAARAFLDAALMPALEAIWPGSDLTDTPMVLSLDDPAPDRDSHLRDVGAYLLRQLSWAPPATRLDALHKLHAPARLAAMLREAYALASVRYLRDKGDVPEPPQVPRAVLALDVSEIVARATALREAFGPLAEAVAADPLASEHAPRNQRFDPEVTREMLDRAIDGVWLSAPGPLFDYLDQIGRGAFDDDPSKISPDAVDLEPGELEAALAQLDDVDAAAMFDDTEPLGDS